MKFTVITDHQALKWLMRIKDISGRLSRWVLKLQGHDMEIIYRARSQHQNVDALTKPPLIQFNKQTQERINSLIAVLPVNEEKNLKLDQKKDPMLGPIIQYLQTGELPKSIKKANLVKGRAQNCAILEDTLIHQ
jgi:hypothetical protein